jgi:hypothetical protein
MSAEPPPARPSWSTRPSWSVWLLVGFGAAFSFLGAATGSREDASALWFLDPLLYAALLVGLWLRGRGRLPVWRPGSARAGGVAFVALSWGLGMAYELSLRTGATGFGGLHPDTLTSFALAQGYYLPLAVGGWWLIRRYRYDLNWAFWTGALAALYELITVGGAVIAGGGVSPLLVPVLLGYYLATYGLFLGMPLLLIDERGLWASPGQPIRPAARVAIAVAFGLALWVVYLGWAAVLALIPRLA